MFLPIQPYVGKSNFTQVPDRIGSVRGNDVVFRLLLLKHQPHRLDVLLRISPIPYSIEIAKFQFTVDDEGLPQFIHRRILDTQVNGGHGHRDFSRHKVQAPPRALMVKQNTAAGKHVIGLTISPGHQMSIQFCHTIRIVGQEWRCLINHFLLYSTVYFSTCRLVKASIGFELSQCLQDSNGAYRCYLRSHDRLSPTVGRHRLSR